jgi:hypothetical protein
MQTAHERLDLSALARWLPARQTPWRQTPCKTILFVHLSLQFRDREPAPRRREGIAVSETISLPVLQNAIEILRRRASGMSPLEKCKLRSLEENARIIREQQILERLERLSARYSEAAAIMRANAIAAGDIADAMWLSNRLLSEKSRTAITRTRHIIAQRQAGGGVFPFLSCS